MIDLHSHILPKLCDGSQSLETSLEMARIAVSSGTTHLACTPHVYPGVYNNSTETIAPALASLQATLDEHDIPLKLIIGADTHMLPEVIRRLKDGSIPTLNNTRYFLLEPSHHVPVEGFLDQVENFINSGYVPLITHPERLCWVHDHYDDFVEAARMGAWIQITAGAISGVFGKKVQSVTERFLTDGVVHVIASDAHGVGRRPPDMSKGVEAAIKVTRDSAEVMRMVVERPQAVLDNMAPELVAKPPGLVAGRSTPPSKKRWLPRFMSRLAS
ncbi:capsular biosynthesis protein [Leucothrix sargassi]|nr:capsular biosynthesis protein [Leucothrix sargassi]